MPISSASARLVSILRLALHLDGARPVDVHDGVVVQIERASPFATISSSTT